MTVQIVPYSRQRGHKEIRSIEGYHKGHAGYSHACFSGDHLKNALITSNISAVSQDRLIGGYFIKGGDKKKQDVPAGMSEQNEEPFVHTLHEANTSA